MIKIALIVLFGLNFAYASSPQFNLKETDQANRFIRENNSAEVDKLLAGKDNGAPDYACFLSRSLELSKDDHVCRTAIVQTLLKKDAKPTEGQRQMTIPCPLEGGMRQHDLTNAFKSYCVETIKALTTEMSDSDIEFALIHGATPMQIPPYNSDGTESQIHKNAIETLKYVKQSLIDLCTKKGQMGEECHDNDIASALRDIKGTEDKEAAAVKDIEFFKQKNAQEKVSRDQQIQNDKNAQQFASSPEGITKAACDSYNQIKQADQLIAHENAVGEASGYVNKAALHQAGQMKVFGQNDLKKYKDMYRKKTGTDLNIKNCKTEKLDL